MSCAGLDKSRFYVREVVLTVARTYQQLQSFTIWQHCKVGSQMEGLVTYTILPMKQNFL